MMSFRASEACMKLSDFDDCSRESFEKLVNKTSLNSKRYEVLIDRLRWNPGLTARELWHMLMPDERALFNNEIGDYKPRLTELKKSGDIVRVGKRECTINGNTCSIYEVMKK